MKRLTRIQSDRLIWIMIGAAVLLLVWFGLPVSSASRNPYTPVFQEAWQTVSDHFYDPDFNGQDWKGVRKRYQDRATQAQSTDAVADIINQMLAELQTSHTHFYTQAEPAYYQLLGIFQGDADLRKRLQQVSPDGSINYVGLGLFTQTLDGKTFIRAILDKSSAAEAGLKVGDQILGVDAKPYQPIRSFVGKAGQPVTLSIQRTADSSSRQEIQVIPQRFDPTRMFLDAQKASVQVLQRGGKKIGYIHIWCYAGDQYQQLLTQELVYGRLRSADGLVLDLRDGWGGASPEYLNLFTARGPNLTMIGRNRQQVSHDYQWKKPVVMLVNEGSRSGKEILAFGFQHYQIGPVVGSKTAAAVVAGRPFLMQDGSLLYLAVADVLVDGKRLEGQGVTPDIEVPFTVPYAEGADPQKEQAIETVLAELK